MLLISVLIPVYNGAATVRDSIASIQSQLIRDIEIIVVDDGSTDDTPAILNEMEKTDKRIRILTKKNGGIVDALNAGLKLCSGEYVARHDADDLAYPNRFSLQLEYLRQHPECVGVSGSVSHIDGNGNPTGYVATYLPPVTSDPKWIPSKEPYLIHPFLMVRRAALQSVRGYRYVFHAEDTDLYWRLQEMGVLHNMPEVLGEYRIHEGSISSKSVLNGRIAALNSQLAAISAARRKAGAEDIVFPQNYLAQYHAAKSISDMLALWKDMLTKDEFAYLKIATLIKLLELTTYRPYEVEESDCQQTRQGLKHPPSFITAENYKWVNGLIANAGGRLLLNGNYKKAYILLPARLYLAAIMRFIFRKFASPAARRKVKHILGKQMAPTDFTALEISQGSAVLESDDTIKNVLPQSSLGKSAVSGIVWLLAQSLVGRVTIFISQLVLAKILMPEDFGILGLAYTITTLFGVLTNVGIDAVLQQRGAKMRLWTTQAFWANLAITSLVALGMALYAPYGAKLYHNAQVVNLVWIIALSLPLNALAMVPQAKLQLLMKFKFLAYYNTLELILIQLLTIGFALSRFGAISFVLPVPILAFVRAIIFWRIAPFKLRSVRFSNRWKMMLGRGVTLFGSALALALIEQGDYITLGLFSSAYALGIYYFAFKLAIQPIRMLAGSFSNVLFPVLTSLSTEPDRQVSATLKSSETLGIIIIPICFLQAAIAQPALTYLFGERWADAIPFIQILSLGLSLDALSWPLGALLSARGEFGRISKYHILSVPFFYALVLTGVHLGSVTGVAIAVSVYYVIHPVAFSLLTLYREGISVYRVLSAYISPLLLAVCAFGTAYALSKLSVFNGLLIMQVVVITVVGVTMYFLGVRKFLAQTYEETRKQVLGFLGRNKARI